MWLRTGHPGVVQDVLEAIGKKADFGYSGVAGFETRETSGIFPKLIEHMLEKEHIAQLKKQVPHAARQPARLVKPVSCGDESCQSASSPRMLIIGRTRA